MDGSKYLLPSGSLNQNNDVSAIYSMVFLGCIKIMRALSRDLHSVVFSYESYPHIHRSQLFFETLANISKNDCWPVGMWIRRGLGQVAHPAHVTTR